MGLDSAISVLRREVKGLQAVYSFGSQASGDARADSDVDLAFLSATRIEPEARWMLQEKIASQLGRDVDLVDLARASTVFRAQVVTTGDLVLDVSPPKTAAFEATALSAYARLAEERREIVRDIRERGSVHG